MKNHIILSASSFVGYTIETKITQYEKEIHVSERYKSKDADRDTDRDTDFNQIASFTRHSDFVHWLYHRSILSPLNEPKPVMIDSGEVSVNNLS